MLADAAAAATFQAPPQKPPQTHRDARAGLQASAAFVEPGPNRRFPGTVLLAAARLDLPALTFQLRGETAAPERVRAGLAEAAGAPRTALQAQIAAQISSLLPWLLGP